MKGRYQLMVILFYSAVSATILILSESNCIQKLIGIPKGFRLCICVYLVGIHIQDTAMAIHQVGYTQVIV